MNQRITDIEIHLMHQEAVIQELNEVVVRQQRQIDELAATVAIFREQLRMLEPSMVRAPEDETPPPHY